MDATKPMAQLSRIQIRYHVRYLTWMRLRAWALSCRFSMSDACDALLSAGLDAAGVTADPHVLLQLPVGDDER